MNKFPLKTIIVGFLMMLVGIVSFVSLIQPQAHAQTQSRGYGVGDYGNVVEFTLKDGVTHCVFAEEGDRSVAITCNWK